MSTLKCLAVPIMFCLVHASMQAETRPLELKWNELASTIQGHLVELTLTGGATVTGDVAAIREDVMVLDVKKTSDSKTYPKGNASVPRTSIQLVKLRKSAVWGKTLGITLGVLTGLTVGGVVVVNANLKGEGPIISVFPRNRGSDLGCRISAGPGRRPADHHDPDSAVALRGVPARGC